MFISKKISISAILAAAALFIGCISNDIPYPRIQANFVTFEVENSLQATSIDSIARTVTVFLNESADPMNVKVTDFVLSPEGVEWPDSAAYAGGVDLTSEIKTRLTLYQDYEWTISAVQTIERYFTIDNQIGASTIDVPGRRVVAYVPRGTNLNAIEVASVKLAGSEAKYSPDIEGKTVDFSRPVDVTVTEHGRKTVWTIYIQESETSVSMDRVDAWTSVAWLYGNAQAGKSNGFQYREEGSDVWTDVPDDWVTHNGGAFTARLIHLQPNTSYSARAISDDEFSAPVDFTTESTYDIPNGSMDEWWLDGKIWCPWPENGQPFWGSGNKGATTLGTSNTFPTTETSSGNGQAAQLETRFVGIGIIGKLAAGNLFAGTYVRTDGTDGVLDFGRPFTLHPTALTGYLKYKTAPISSTTSGFESLKNQPDTCVVWCALIDSDQPFQIRTKASDRHLFNPDADDVVAYGIIQYGYNIDNYQPFRVELKYRDTSRRPKYILIVASASKYGDYYTGGNGAVMCVDNFTLDWDY